MKPAAPSNFMKAETSPCLRSGHVAHQLVRWILDMEKVLSLCRMSTNISMIFRRVRARSFSSKCPLLWPQVMDEINCGRQHYALKETLAEKITMAQLGGRDAGVREWQGRFSPWPFKRGTVWAEVPFRSNIIGNFIVYHYRIETRLLQLFAHQENSEGFSIIFLLISLRSTLLLNGNKHNW